MELKPATKCVYRVHNNFEIYYTFEEPSQNYQTEYIIQCLRVHKMRLTDIRFEVTPIPLNMRNVPVGKYK